MTENRLHEEARRAVRQKRDYKLEFRTRTLRWQPSNISKELLTLSSPEAENLWRLSVQSSM